MSAIPSAPLIWTPGLWPPRRRRCLGCGRLKRTWIDRIRTMMAGGLQVGSSGVVIGEDGAVVTDADDTPCCCTEPAAEPCVYCTDPTPRTVNVSIDYTYAEDNRCIFYAPGSPQWTGCVIDATVSGTFTLVQYTDAAQVPAAIRFGSFANPNNCIWLLDGIGSITTTLYGGDTEGECLTNAIATTTTTLMAYIRRSGGSWIVGTTPSGSMACSSHGNSASFSSDCHTDASGSLTTLGGTYAVDWP